MVADRVAALIDSRTGLAVSTAGGRDQASVLRCKVCRSLVLVGLDEEALALTARAEVAELTPAAELAALLAGRMTYRLHRDPAGRWRLRRRDHWQIAGSPAGVVTVVAEHRCGELLGEPLDLFTPAIVTPQEVPF